MIYEQEVARRLLQDEQLGVLATVGDGQPLCSLMTFAATNDLARIVLVTSRDTAKFRHMQANPRVSMLIDNRSEAGRDFTRTAAMTLMGEAREVTGKRREELAEVLLEKDPHLRDFVQSEDCAVMELEIESRHIIGGFQTGRESAHPV